MEVSEPQKSINEVVSSVKSEGLFDQFRKECLEEFDNMDNYRQLKQQVENHVASFLSKHKYNASLQKNMLRNELRNHITKSEVILNSVKQLVDEVLSAKGHSFCLIIDKQVDKYLNKDEKIELSNTQPAPDTNVKERTEVTEIEEVQMELNDKVESESAGDLNSGNNSEKQIVNGLTEGEKHDEVEKFIENQASSKESTLPNLKNETSCGFEYKNSDLVTEPISDDSSCVDFIENVTNTNLTSSAGNKSLQEIEGKNIRRRSSRARVIPLKYRDEEESDSGNEGKKKIKRLRNKILDDTESISSNDIDDIQDRKIVITIRSKKNDNDTDSVSSNDDSDNRVSKKLIIKLTDDSVRSSNASKASSKLVEGTAVDLKKDSSQFQDENSKMKRGRPPKRNSVSEDRKRKHSSATNENESDDESIVSKRGRRSVRRQCYSPS